MEVKYVDNGIICGWYLQTEDSYIGDGTKEEAEALYKEYNQED